MAQLGVKVNHFGKTAMINLYKNQRITNFFRFYFMSFNRGNNVALAANATDCSAPQLPQNIDRRRKKLQFRQVELSGWFEIRFNFFLLNPGCSCYYNNISRQLL